MKEKKNAVWKINKIKVTLYEFMNDQYINNSLKPSDL